MSELVYCKSRKGRSTYDKIIKEAKKPVKERNKVVSNSHGITKAPRRYFLLEDKLDKLWKEYENTGVFPNPYRGNGVYNSFIQALINLGVNESHKFMSVKREMKSIMEKKKDKSGINLWEKFSNKHDLNKASAWDENAKIEYTAKILQRLGGNHPYGYKLSQLHACVDILISTDPILPNKPNFRLNTQFNSRLEVYPVKVKRSRRKNTICD